MKSLLHFCWVGKIPSQKSLKNLFRWQKYLLAQGTEFQVRLSVDRKLFEQFSQPSFCDAEKADNCLVLHDRHDASISIQIQNIDLLIGEVQHLISTQIIFYNFMTEQELYVFSSDFLKLIILNAQPGFYLDFDITPNDQAKFPKSLDAIKIDAQHQFYCYWNGGIIENQVILSFNTGLFIELLQEFFKKGSRYDIGMLKRMEETVSTYKAAILHLKEIIHNDPALMMHAEFMTHFRDVHIKKIKKNGLFYELQQYCKEKYIKYETIKNFLSDIQVFYYILRHEYLEEFTPSKSMYQSNFLDCIASVIQDCFLNPMQDNTCEYSWSSPVYFHLKKMQWFANTLGEMYLNRCEKRKTKLLVAAKFGNISYIDEHMDYIKRAFNKLEKRPSISRSQSIMVAMLHTAAEALQWETILYFYYYPDIQLPSYFSHYIAWKTAIDANRFDIFKLFVKYDCDHRPENISPLLNFVASLPSVEKRFIEYIFHMSSEKKIILDKLTIRKVFEQFIDQGYLYLVNTLIQLNESYKEYILCEQIAEKCMHRCIPKKDVKMIKWLLSFYLENNITPEKCIFANALFILLNHNQQDCETYLKRADKNTFCELMKILIIKEQKEKIPKFCIVYHGEFNRAIFLEYWEFILKQRNFNLLEFFMTWEGGDLIDQETVNQLAKNIVFHGELLEILFKSTCKYQPDTNGILNALDEVISYYSCVKNSNEVIFSLLKLIVNFEQSDFLLKTLENLFLKLLTVISDLENWLLEDRYQEDFDNFEEACMYKGDDECTKSDTEKFLQSICNSPAIQELAREIKNQALLNQLKRYMQPQENNRSMVVFFKVAVPPFSSGDSAESITPHSIH